MVDDICFLWNFIKPLNFYRRIKDSFEYRNMIFDPNIVNGKVTYYESRLNNLRVRMTDQGFAVFGSVHKYLKGENHSRFDHAELSYAIEDLANVFGKEFWRADLRFITPAVNLPLAAKDYFERLQMIKGKPTRPMLGGSAHVPYGAYVKRAYEKYKVYDKQFEARVHSRLKISATTRIEREINLARANKSRTRSKVIFSPSDLCREEFKDYCYTELIDMIDSFVYDESVNIKNLSSPKELVSLLIFSKKSNTTRYKELVCGRTFKKDESVYSKLISEHAVLNLKSRLLEALDEEFNCL